MGLVAHLSFYLGSKLGVVVVTCSALQERSPAEAGL